MTAADRGAEERLDEIGSHLTDHRQQAVYEGIRRWRRGLDVGRTSRLGTGA